MIRRHHLALVAALSGACGPDSGSKPGDTSHPTDSPTDSTDEHTGAVDTEAPPEPPTAGALAISEIMPKNRTGVLDEDGHESDWIELHNVSATPIDLTDVGLGDLDAPWRFPAATLPAGETLLVFASGKDRSGDELHTDFKLSAGGESLWLTAADGAVLDAFDPYPEVDTGVSYGRAGAILATSAGGYAWRAPVDHDTAWTDPAFDDASWATGAGALGVSETAGGPLAHLSAVLTTSWSFDAATDGVVADQAGLHDGVLERGAALTTDGSGRTGEALAGDSGGWLAAVDPEGYDFNGDHTWSLWFRGADASGCLISRNPAGTAWNQGSKALFVRDGTLQYDAGWVGNPQTGAAVTDGDWHHAAVRFSASDDRLQLWLDGAIAYDATFDANAFDETVTDNGGAAASGLFVGEANFSGGLPDLGKYSGQIDDVALFHAALTPDDLALLAGGATPTAGTYPTAIDTELPDGTSRAQLRLVFDVDDPAALTGMVVEARYDDALLLWLNGELVAERGATVGAEAAATDRDDSLVAVPASIPLPTELLVAGQNVLAAEVLAADGSASAYLDLAVTASTDTLGMLASESPGAPNGPLMSGGVLFSSPSLTFAGPFTLELTGPAPGAVVRYTTDGSEPGEASTLYEGPITVDRTMELRARAWEEGLGAGPVSQRLFVEVAPDLRDTVRDLPVIVMISPGIGASWSPAPLLAFDAGDDLGADAAFAGPASAHVRGQSSASQPKQPYRLELRDARGHDASHPLLGLSDDADWVLHAPYVDKSLMRNALAFELGRAAGLDAPATAYAHLYVGEPGEALTDAHYRGVYVLMETIEISSDRLDLASIGPEVDSEPELSGAYLLKFEADVAESPILAGWSTLELAEPDPVTDVQLDWIADHIADFDAVLFSGDFADPATGYAAWIDVGSWVDTVILHELFRDQDAYVRSAWFYKDQEGPLVMGPLWDFNLVAGTGGYFGNTDLEGWQWAHGYNAGEHGWFERLMTDPAFADAVQDRWWTLRAGALSDEAMAATIATHAAALESGAADNFALWDNLGDPSVNGFVSPATDTWAQQVDALADWLAARSAWIDGELD